MDELSLNPEFLKNLILRTRGLMAQEAHGLDDDGGNPTDDNAPTALQATDGDLSRDELNAEIEDLEPDQQAELVALMWIGRGDMEPEEWEEAVGLAVERRADGPTSAYLLSHALLAEYWDEGVDRLLDGSDLVETGEY